MKLTTWIGCALAALALSACAEELDNALLDTSEQSLGPIRCPQLSPPGPGFCRDGTIVVVKDADGCPFYDCQRAVGATTLVQRPPLQCPQLVPPGPGYCEDGTIEIVKNAMGCPSFRCRR